MSDKPIPNSEETDRSAGQPRPTVEDRLPVLEALLFSADAPLAPRKLAEILDGLTEKNLRDMVERLNQAYEQTGRAFRIKFVAGGYRMYTLPDFAPYIEKLYQSRQSTRLSQKALETLAIIAYRQPITRPEIERIRGVNVDSVIKTLLNRKLITIAGTADAPGTPYLYRTTEKFLEYFGLKSLKDLPRLKEIDEILQADEEGLLPEGIVIEDIDPTVLGLEKKQGSHGSKKDSTTESQRDNRNDSA